MMIRSQDRTKLAPLNRAVVVDGCKIMISEETENHGWELGEYDSESRCLEILDEIQNEFRYSNHYSGSGVNSSNCQSCGYGVYQMPEK